MTIIDKETWHRKEHYDFFAPISSPFYDITFPVDVTELRAYVKAHDLSFYMALVFLATKAMNAVEAFRYKDRNGQIVLHERLVPSFTDMKPGSDLFHIVTLEAGEDLADFCRRAKACSAAQTELCQEHQWARDELIFFTCAPWFPFTALTHERDMDPSDSVPQVAWGKFEERDGRYILSMSMELNHRLLDGWNIGQFYDTLREYCKAL